MRGYGNNVPQRQPHQNAAAVSNHESYSSASGSYSEEESEMVPSASMPHHHHAMGASSAASNMDRGSRRSVGRQSVSTSRNMNAGERREEGGETAQKGRAPPAVGRGTARDMMNTVLSAPVARVRAVRATLIGKDSQRVTIYVFFGVMWVHLLFVILASALSQIDISGGGCFTYWGFKSKCDTVSYTNRTALILNCDPLRESLQAGAAFSILGILTSAVGGVLAWVLCSQLRDAARQARLQKRYRNADAPAGAVDNAAADGGETAVQQQDPVQAPFDAGQLKLVIMVVVGISLMFELICWAIIASINTAQYCNDIYQWSTTATYGVGFGLALTGWIMELIVFLGFVAMV